MSSEHGKNKGFPQKVGHQIDWHRIAKGYKQALKVSLAHTAQESHPAKEKNSTSNLLETAAK